MKTSQVISVCASIMTLVPAVYADRQLNSQETQDLLGYLMTNSRQAWLTSGTLKADHTEYHAPQTTDVNWVNARIEQETQDYLARKDKPQLTALGQQNYLDAIPFNVRYQWLNEYTQTDQREVKINGGRYHYTIAVQTHDDSMVPTGNLVDNPETDQFRLANGRERNFYWDGQAYTRCYNSVANAIISDQDTTPKLAITPLTAGLLTWGRGYLDLDHLKQAKITAMETERAGQPVIQLTITQGNDVAISMVLDPNRDYAVLEHETIQPSFVELAELSGYVQTQEGWIPTEIYTERQDPGGRLLESNQWHFTISDTAPASSSFQAHIPVKTHVMRRNSQSSTPLYYYYNPSVNSDRLFAERLEILNDHYSPHNCASVQFRYAAERLGQSLSMADVGTLVQADGMTSFLDMAQMAKKIGLHTRAARLSWDDLQNLGHDVQVILYCPGHDHFILLDYVNPTEAWIIDLSGNTFYRPLNKDIFSGQDTFDVLLLSNDSISPDLGEELTPESQADIRGGYGGGYCDIQMQQTHEDSCIQVDGCGGYDTIYYEYWWCEDVPYTMCQEVTYIGRIQYPCILYDGYYCNDGDPLPPVTVWACDGVQKY